MRQPRLPMPPPHRPTGSAVARVRRRSRRRPRCCPTALGAAPAPLLLASAEALPMRSRAHACRPHQWLLGAQTSRASWGRCARWRAQARRSASWRRVRPPAYNTVDCGRSWLVMGAGKYRITCSRYPVGPDYTWCGCRGSLLGPTQTKVCRLPNFTMPLAGPESMVYAVKESCAVHNASSCTAPYLDFCQHTFNL